MDAAEAAAKIAKNTGKKTTGKAAGKAGKKAGTKAGKSIDEAASAAKGVNGNAGAAELIEKMNFNDSCVNELVYANEMVLLNIDLCMWKQNGYQDKEPELKKVILKFLNVTNCNWDSEKDEKDIDYDSIINITCENSTIKIVLEDEDISILTFESNEVEID